MEIYTMKWLVLSLAFLAMSPIAGAQTVAFDFTGNGGVGLLPGSEVGPNTSFGSNSTAFGGESAAGIIFDTATNLLDINFSFNNLDGGLLFDAASGIHLHLPTVAGDPFNQTGPIVFNLNSFNDAAVTNSNSQILDGATSGTVSAQVDFSNNLELVDDLLAGEIYLNIHSQTFSGGELRGTVSPSAVPEPSSAVLLGLALSTGALLRRRK